MRRANRLGFVNGLPLVLRLWGIGTGLLLLLWFHHDA
jgi:hypothetical protein